MRTSEVAAFSFGLEWEPLNCQERRSEIASYTVYYGMISTYSELNRFVLGNLTNTSVVVEDVMADSTYLVQVVAVSREGMAGPSSSLLTITTLSPREP